MCMVETAFEIPGVIRDHLLTAAENADYAALLSEDLDTLGPGVADCAKPFLVNWFRKRIYARAKITSCWFVRIKPHETFEDVDFSGPDRKSAIMWTLAPWHPHYAESIVLEGGERVGYGYARNAVLVDLSATQTIHNNLHRRLSFQIHSELEFDDLLRLDRNGNLFAA